MEVEKEIVKAQRVSMDFRLESNRPKSLKEFAVTALTRKSKPVCFQALQDVSFTVGKGEVIGIIGRNGSGKSTLLKIIAGIMKPTKGLITCRGNIVPMLELGSGFDTELTGRENLFLNGAILGYSKKYLIDREHDIIAFSELGQFIDEPLRTYSSGMMMRLAFSIATIVNPEILIVDEILAVGDAPFQEKSRARMLELMSGGTTVFFVSHSLEQIREMCTRVIWLEHGRIRMIGQTTTVCNQYEREG